MQHDSRLSTGECRCVTLRFNSPPLPNLPTLAGWLWVIYHCALGHGLPDIFVSGSQRLQDVGVTILKKFFFQTMMSLCFVCQLAIGTELAVPQDGIDCQGFFIDLESILGLSQGHNTALLPPRANRRPRQQIRQEPSAHIG
jgi:hypothetical protein